MAKYETARGQTGNIAFVFLPDTSSTTGGGKTALTNASAGLNIAVRREKSATFTAYSGANIGTITTLGTWANPGIGKCNFKEVDSTNAPGLYELHFEDAQFSTSDTSRKLVGMVQATGVAPTPFEVELTGMDVQSLTPALSAADSPSVHNGTAQAGNAVSITLDSGAVATDNLYRGQRVKITGGTGAGQSRHITTYTGATRVALVDHNWIVNPDATSVFSVIDSDGPAVDSSLAIVGVDSVENPVMATDTNGDPLATAAAQTDIKAKTDLIATNAADSPEVVTAVGTISTLLTRVTGPVMLAASYAAPDNADIAAIVAVTNKVNTMLATSGLNWTYTVDALKNGPAGGGGGGTGRTINEVQRIIFEKQS